MRTQLLLSLSLALLAAGCAAPSRSIATRQPLVTPSAAPQDYSPRSMFQETHGDFMVRADRYRPMARAALDYRPSASIKDEPGEFDITTLGGTIRMPIVADPDSYLLIGGDAHGRRYEFSATVRGGLQDETVYGVGARLGYGRFLTDDTRLEIEFRPGVYSDLEGQLTSKDWEFFGDGIVTFRYTEDLYLKGGLRVSEDFEELPVFPVAGLSWMFLPEWRLDLLLPTSAEVTWQTSAATMLHAGLELHGNEYRVRSTPATNKQRSDLQVQEIDLYIGATHRFDDNLSIFGRLGATMAGDYHLRGPGGTRVEGTLDPTLLFEIGVGFDF